MPEKEPFRVCPERSWKDAETCIRSLQLSPLPREGGFFRRIHTSESVFSHAGGFRRSASSILYLLRGGDVSRLHRLRSAEELWFFLEGSPAEHLVLSPESQGRTFLGHGPERVSHVLVPSMAWQGARLCSSLPEEYGLFGITVSPEYLDEDYEEGETSEILRNYPEWREHVLKFTEHIQ